MSRARPKKNSERTLRTALVQLRSGVDVGKNIAEMKRQTWKAAKAGARWIQFPEMAYQMSSKAVWRHEVEKYPEYLETFQAWAKELGVVLLPGTLREPSHRKGSYFNSLPVIGPNGRLLKTYRKLHLFQANLPDRRYNEAAYTCPGEDAMVVDLDGVKLGLTICFDLRFPELFRKLKHAGAQVITVPSAFVHHTGKAHWEVLLRARAIENQVFILAPNQTGIVGTGSRTFGHTLAVSPWGTVIGKKKAGVGSVLVDLNLDELKTVTQSVDAWACRRPELLPYI